MDFFNDYPLLICLPFRWLHEKRQRGCCEDCLKSSHKDLDRFRFPKVSSKYIYILWSLSKIVLVLCCPSMPTFMSIYYIAKSARSVNSFTILAAKDKSEKSLPPSLCVQFLEMFQLIKLKASHPINKGFSTHSAVLFLK